MKTDAFFLKLKIQKDGLKITEKKVKIGRCLFEFQSKKFFYQFFILNKNKSYENYKSK